MKVIFFLVTVIFNNNLFNFFRTIFYNAGKLYIIIIFIIINYGLILKIIYY